VGNFTLALSCTVEIPQITCSWKRYPSFLYELQVIILAVGLA
jgi:hypothetical protein